jgi:hypothetical protein
MGSDAPWQKASRSSSITGLASSVVLFAMTAAHSCTFGVAGTEVELSIPSHTCSTISVLKALTRMAYSVIFAKRPEENRETR